MNQRIDRVDQESFKSMALVKSTSSYRFLANVLIVLFLVVVAAVIITPWQQYSTGVGRVIAYAPDDRLQIISSPVDGRIAKWYISEGATVKAGDPLVQLSDLDPQIISRLQSELESALQRMQAAKQAVELSELNLKRQKQLSEKGLSSQRTYELAQLEYSKMLSALSDATAELAQVEVKFSRQSAQVVNAPTDGVVQRIFGSSNGLVIKTGDSLVTLAPTNNSSAVELLVDGNDVPLITLGRKTRIQFEGWPAVQIVGWPSIAIGTFGGTVGVVDPVDDGSGKFRIIVFPDPDDIAWPDRNFLRLGVRAQGWVLMDSVKLWYEIWRRFNGFPKTANQYYSQSDHGSGEYQ